VKTAVYAYLSFSELLYEIVSTADVVVLHVMKYGTVIADGGLELTWMDELNQHCVARQKENKIRTQP
jgi:Fe-S cluster assembly ATPase SufC